jgi:hypothetical protein
MESECRLASPRGRAPVSAEQDPHALFSPSHARIEPAQRPASPWVGLTGTMYYVDLQKADTMAFQCAQLGYTGLISYSIAKEKAGS